MIATCPASGRLHDFVLGKLQEQESDELYGHLAGCESCQQQLEKDESFSDTFIGQLKSGSADQELDAEPAFLRASSRARDMVWLLNRNAGDGSGHELPGPVPGIIGEYEVDRLIGHGGMGTVYLARHTKLGRAVALKVLSRHRLADPRMLGRFETEMKAVGRMNHPNIVAAHDAREIDGVAVLVTEFIDGLNAGSIVRRTGPLSVANSARIATDVATALAAIDEAGLIHRDIKPSNIMVSRTGQVKLLDLGLARLQTADSDGHDFTASGQALGTVDYIAPEQVSDGRNVDVRADIYALGCTLFKLLTGRAVFDDARHATAFAKMTAHVRALPPSVTEFVQGVPAPLVALVAAMLQKDPASRPQTPQAIVEELAPFAAGANLAALVEHASTTEEKPRPARPGSASTIGVNAAEPRPSFASRIPFFATIALAGSVFGWAIAWMMGIEITIRHPDGTTTRLHVANGSTVTIDENGNATVLLPGSTAEPEVRALSIPQAGHPAGPGVRAESLPGPRSDVPANALPGLPSGPVRADDRSSDWRKGPAGQDSAVDVVPAGEDPLTGVWRFQGPGRFEGACLVLANGQFSIVGGPDGAGPDGEEPHGYWRHDPGANPPRFDLGFSGGGPPDPQLGIYELPSSNELRLWFAPPHTDRLEGKSDSADYLQLHRVDLSGIPDERELPGHIAPGVWRKWKELLSQEVAPAGPDDGGLKARAARNEEREQAERARQEDHEDHWGVDPAVPDQLTGVWKFKSPSRFQGAFLVLANGRFAIVGGPETGLEGNWKHDPSASPPRFDLEFSSGGPPDPQLGIYGLNARGELKVWFAPPGDGRLREQRDGTDQLHLSRMEVTGIASADEVPVELGVDGWRKWQELSGQSGSDRH